MHEAHRECQQEQRERETVMHRFVFAVGAIVAHAAIASASPDTIESREFINLFASTSERSLPIEGHKLFSIETDALTTASFMTLANDARAITERSAWTPNPAPTHLVPTPGSIALLALAGLATIKRKR